MHYLASTFLASGGITIIFEYLSAKKIAVMALQIHRGHADMYVPSLISQQGISLVLHTILRHMPQVRTHISRLVVVHLVLQTPISIRVITVGRPVINMLVAILSQQLMSATK